MSDAAVLLNLHGVCKSFGATRALHDVDMIVRRGEVHALIGENGAGKSTLMKVLSGAYRADVGEIIFKGKPCVIQSPLDGRRHGIAMIYQELNLAPHLTVEENLTLGIEHTTWGIIRSRAPAVQRALDLLNHSDIPVTARVNALPIGLQQIVEIARALISDAAVIIMDEPTSSLSSADTESLFSAIKRLKQSGIAIIYISHFLEEVYQIADSYTVLRDGETVGSGCMADTDIDGIIRLMVGRTLTEMFPKVEHAIGPVIMRVDGLSGASVPLDVSFELRRGEIMGVAGLVGSGRSETVRRVFGLDRSRRGCLRIGSGTRGGLADSKGGAVDLRRTTPGRALGMKLDFLSEDRKDEGLAVTMSVAANTTLSSIRNFVGMRRCGLLNLRRERAVVARWINDLGIRCAGADQQVVELSGGNQQKVALARILEQGADIVMLDEPTRGVDVGSKVEIYRLIGELAKAGKGVIFVSSYLPELLGVCDTLAVMHRGRMSSVRPVNEWNEHSIMRVATSGDSC